MTYRAALLVAAVTSLSAAEFQTGQAARAVISQSSFTSREQGIKVISLLATKNHLYVADTSRHVFTFDLSKIPDLREDFSQQPLNGCSVCGFSATTVTNESVMPGVASTSTWDKTVAVADPVRHRVLLWKDATSGRLDRGPDVILGRTNDGSAVGAGTLVDPVSVALDGKRIFVGDAALHRVLIWNSFPAADDQPADAVLGQPDFATSSASDSAGPDSIVNPNAMTSDGSNLFVADAANRRILVFSPIDLPLSANAIINSASLVNDALAPGTLILITGNNLSEREESTAGGEKSTPLPRRLGGTEVVFDGQALPLLAVSPTQLQAQLPYDLGARSAASLYVRTERSGGSVTVTNPVSVKLTAASPGIFAFSGREPRGGILLHAGEFQINVEGSPVTGDNPAAPGEVLTVLTTGLGAVSDSGASTPMAGHPYDGPGGQIATPTLAQLNGQSVPVLSARLPRGSVGVYEIRIAVPFDLGGSRQGRLSVTQNGYVSNTVTFALEAAQDSQIRSR